MQKEKGYIHRDIKERNILISSCGIVKICDFGTTTVPAPGLSRSGTTRFMAPEVKDGSSKYSTPADIWSLGITVLMFYLGKAPGKLPKDFTIIKPEVFLEEVKKDIPEVLLQFIMACLDMDQLKRPTATTLLHHPLLSHSRPLQEVGQLVKEIAKKE